MPRIKLLVSALALGLAGASAAQAQEFSAVVSFGDSLTDAGQYAALPPPYYFGAQGSFTTNPDDVWAQELAEAFGLSQTASLAGGSNYAWGGAPTSFTVTGVPFALTCIPSTLPCHSVAQQLTEHLTANGGQADPNALYTYWAGANDLFNYLSWAAPQPNPDPNGPPLPPLITGTQAQLFTGASALTAVGQIGALQAAGASHVVVLNLPDIGLAPAFVGTASQASVSGLVFVYNNTFNGGLASLADGIIPINAYGLVNEAIADPAAFGFSSVTGTACNLALTAGSSLFCTPGALVSPDANNTYLFADGVHPSGAAHRLLARVVIATIQAPGQVSMAGELPLQVYDHHSSVINEQIFGMSSTPRSEGEANVYGQLRYARQDFEASGNTQAFDGNLATGTFGADVRTSEHTSLGASLTFGGSRGDSLGSSIDANEILVSAYGVFHAGAGYLDAIISGGSSSLDIDRRIVLGPTTRTETGNTNARHLALEVGGGFNFGSDSFKHGPFASVTWQQIQVDGYAEDSLDSTAMWFSDFERESTVARLGYKLRATAGRWQPYGRIAYAKESEDDAVPVQAGSNSMNGHFTFDGFLPAQDWIEADLGVDFALNDKTNLSFAYRARLSDDTQDQDAISFGARWEF